MTLELKGVVRTHPGAPAPTLNGVDLEVPAGKLSAVLGPSGAGKSTMLRCVAGLEPFERGEISISGVVVTGTTQAAEAVRGAAVEKSRQRLGVVFQHFELFPHLSALENCVIAPVQVRRQPREVAEPRARHLLDELLLGVHAEKFPSQLSGGQRQRVAIARALSMEPEVLLYDEPTSALDASMKGEVLETLRRVQAQGVTQLVITHDLNLAASVDVVFVMDAGAIVERGAPEQVLKAPQHERTRALLASWAAS